MTAMLERLVTEQNTVWQRMQDIRTAAEDDKRDMSAEERKNWDEAETRLVQVSDDIARLERHAKLEKIDRSQIVATSGKSDRDDAPDGEAAKRYAETFGAYLRRGSNGLKADQQELLESHFLDLSSDNRAQSAGSDTAGGYLVPEGFRLKMVETMKAYGGLMGLAEVITTATGQSLPYPTNDDTANEGEIIGENEEVSEQDITLGQRKLDAFIFSSKMVKASRVLLQDTGFNLDAWLPGKLGERIGRRAARAWTTGTGVDQPQGLTVGGSVGKTGAGGQTTSIIYDDLIDLEHSVDPAYRGRGQYLLHDTMLKVIRKLKDADNRPLWVPIPAPGFPATINGYAYTIDNSMPEPAASAKSVAFGDLQAGYVVRQVLDVQTLRLAERYAEKLQVAFLAFARMDGMVQDSAAFKLYAHPAA